jgi:hypothetical protein
MRALVFTVATAGVAHASTLTFDDIGIGGNIPSGYGGLQWGPFSNYLTATDNPSFFANSGYENGVVSGDFIAYNQWDEDITVSGPTFDFNSAYLTSAWNTGLSITVTGKLGAATLYSQTVVVNTTGPTFFTFDFLGIDQLIFDSFGGVSDLFPQYEDDGHHFVIDNITINEPAAAVPDGGTALAMFGLGMLGLGAIRRRLSF